MWGDSRHFQRFSQGWAVIFCQTFPQLLQNANGVSARMGLLWIFLFLFNGYVAKGFQEKCSRECVVFNIPHILCAPDVSKVSVTPYYECSTVPQFKNLLSKESYLREPYLIYPKKATPDRTVESDSECGQPPATVEVLEGVSKDSPLCKPKSLPCKEPPKVICVEECQFPVLQNAPTSIFGYPDCECGYYPPVYVNPRYLSELAYLYNQKYNNPTAFPKEAYPRNKGQPPQRSSTFNSQGINNDNSKAYASSPPEDGVQSRPMAVQQPNAYSNVPSRQPQYINTNPPKDQVLIPVSTENDDGPAPIYVDPNFMYKFCGTYSHPPQTEPKPHQSHNPRLNHNIGNQNKDSHQNQRNHHHHSNQNQYNNSQKPPQDQYNSNQNPPQDQYYNNQNPPQDQYYTNQNPPQGQYNNNQNPTQDQYYNNQNPPQDQYYTNQNLPQGQYNNNQNSPQDQYYKNQNPPQGQYNNNQNPTQDQYYNNQNPPQDQYYTNQNLPQVQYNKNQNPTQDQYNNNQYPTQDQYYNNQNPPQDQYYNNQYPPQDQYNNNQYLHQEQYNGVQYPHQNQNNHNDHPHPNNHNQYLHQNQSSRNQYSHQGQYNNNPHQHQHSSPPPAGNKDVNQQQDKTPEEPAIPSKNFDIDFTKMVQEEKETSHAHSESEIADEDEITTIEDDERTTTPVDQAEEETPVAVEADDKIPPAAGKVQAEHKSKHRTDFRW